MTVLCLVFAAAACEKTQTAIMPIIAYSAASGNSLLEIRGAQRSEKRNFFLPDGLQNPAPWGMMLL